MKIACLRPSQLRSEHFVAWRRLQQAAPIHDSPFFSPEFTLAMAEVRCDVFVAVMEIEDEPADRQPVGFLPFQRNSLGIGHPVGWRLSDFHGPILRSDVSLDVNQLLRACGMITWRFDHLATNSDAFQPYLCATEESPCMDLGDGFDAYCQNRGAAGSDLIQQTERKARKLGREVGEVRFEYHDTDRTALEAMLRLKAEQLRRDGQFPILRLPWVHDLLERLRETAVEGFAGQLSSLYAGEHLVAVHFGLRSREVMHWWITAYDRQFERHSPGSILLLRLAQEAAAAGVQRIDLGKGSETYKQRFKNGTLSVGEGTLSRGRLWRHCSRLGYEARRIVRTTRLRTAAQLSKRVARQARCWLTTGLGRDLAELDLKRPK